MKRFFLAAIVAVMWLFAVGCTYETTVEEASVPPVTDAGAFAPLEDGDMRVGQQGASGSKQLTRGTGGPDAPSTILSESFLNAQGQGAAGVYTVQFSTRPTSGVVPDGLPYTSTNALVTWTIGGNHMQRLVTVANGVTLAGVGEACSVSVYDQTVGVPPNDPIPNYTVTASLSPGTRGSSGNPPLYYPHFTGGIGGAGGTPTTGSVWVLAAHTNPGESILIPVPPNSGLISVSVTGFSDTNGVAPLIQVRQAVLVGVGKTYDPALYTGFIPLDPATKFVGIDNLDANHSVTVSCVFGVDG